MFINISFLPAFKQLARQEPVTLTCLVASFHLADILVTWTHGDVLLAPESIASKPGRGLHRLQPLGGASQPMAMWLHLLPCHLP